MEDAQVGSVAEACLSRGSDRSRSWTEARSAAPISLVAISTANRSSASSTAVTCSARGGCQQRRGTRRLGQPAQHRRVRCQPLAGQACRPCRRDLTHGHAASPQAGDLRRPVQRPHHPRTRRSRRRPPQPVQLRPAGTVRHHQQTVQAAAQLPARRCSPRPTRRPGSVVVDRVRAEVVQYDPDPHLRWVRRAQATNEGGELDPALAGLDVPVEPVGGQVVAGQQRAARRSAAGRHRRLAPPVGGPQGRRRNPGSCR